MTKKVDLNNSFAWQSLNWDDKDIHPDLKKSDATVNRARSAFFKRDNPEFSDTMSQVAKERNQDSAYIEAYQQGIANRDNSYQAESNSRPEVRAKISKALAGKPKSKEHKQALKSTTTNRYGDANYEAAHRAGLAKRDKPFHAGEYGIFQSRSEAAKYATGQGLKNALKKFEAWSKSNPKEYYFIDLNSKDLN
jgi:hypothetical protein